MLFCCSSAVSWCKNGELFAGNIHLSDTCRGGLSPLCIVTFIFHILRPAYQSDGLCVIHSCLFTHTFSMISICCDTSVTNYKLNKECGSILRDESSVYFNVTAKYL